VLYRLCGEDDETEDFVTRFTGREEKGGCARDAL
jgi:hypothetical protein